MPSNPRPTWVRRAYTATAIAALLALAAVAYFYFQVTADVYFEVSEGANSLDAKEAERKLGLYLEAEKIARRGFVRLSEVEINSYLQQRFFSDSDNEAGAEPPLTSKTGLLKSRARLSTDALTWCCWIKKEWLGRSRIFVWQRTFEMIQNENGSPDLELTTMTVGSLDVPRPLWPTVEAAFGEVDAVFTNQVAWLTRLPTVEIKTNVFSSRPEVRLFTYRLSMP